MSVSIPFGMAEIDGNAVNVVELSLPEVAAFSQFIPNSFPMIISMLKAIEFSGRVPPLIAHDDKEVDVIQRLSTETPIPNSDDPEIVNAMFEKWLSDITPIGIHSLVERGLVVINADGTTASHRSIDSIFKILSTAVEHVSYRATQVPESSTKPPVLRSSLYGVQSLAGDWMFAEHYQSHNYIRFVCISGSNELHRKAYAFVMEGVTKAATTEPSSESGVRFVPFSITVSRTNSHGAFMLATVHAKHNTNGLTDWYTAYDGTAIGKIVGDYVEKMGNPFVTKQHVAELSSLPYTQLDIRNGIEGWNLVGNTAEVLKEITSFLNMTLHSDADHVPDTIPEDFFEGETD